jgi:hypothetical protein
MKQTLIDFPWNTFVSSQTNDLTCLVFEGKYFNASNKGSDNGQFWAPGQPNGGTASACLVFTKAGLDDSSCSGWVSPFAVLCEVLGQ